jgi:hypothetical protein
MATSTSISTSISVNTADLKMISKQLRAAAATIDAILATGAAADVSSAKALAVSAAGGGPAKKQAKSAKKVAEPPEDEEADKVKKPRKLSAWSGYMKEHHLAPAAAKARREENPEEWEQFKADFETLHGAGAGGGGGGGGEAPAPVKAQKKVTIVAAAPASAPAEKPARKPRSDKGKPRAKPAAIAAAAAEKPLPESDAEGEAEAEKPEEISIGGKTYLLDSQHNMLYLPDDDGEMGEFAGFYKKGKIVDHL